MGHVTIHVIMTQVRVVTLIGALILCSGCAWLGFFHHGAVEERSARETSTAASFVKTGKGIDVGRLRKGGKLLIVPFSAGANVVANERSDKIAMMIVTGTADELKGSRFQILNDENAREADLIMTGHVTGTGKPSKWGRWFLRASQNDVSVEGRMADAVSGATVLVFTDSARASPRERDHAQLGYEIGKDIGRFIVSAAD